MDLNAAQAQEGSLPRTGQVAPCNQSWWKQMEDQQASQGPLSIIQADIVYKQDWGEESYKVKD